MLVFGFPFGGPSWSFAKRCLRGRYPEQTVQSASDSAGVAAGAPSSQLPPLLRAVQPGFPERCTKATTSFKIGLTLIQAFVQFARFNHRQFAIHLMDLTSCVGGLHGQLLSEG